MRLAILFVCLTVGLVQAQDDAAKKEIVKFKGDWALVSLDDPSGAKVPDEVVKTIRFTFTDDKMIFKVGDRVIEAAYKLDPTQKPAAIDVIRKRDQKEEVAKGIYLLEGDTLKVCASETGFERPKEFKTDADTKTGIMIMKREKK